MFNGSLYEFQAIHEDNLLRKCADHEELILSAPTGSGKTVMACKFICDYLDENPKTVFLWLCPGAGSLEKQSQDSFREVVIGVPDGDVYSFINDEDPSGKVFFINWDKINRESNIVLREGEHRDLMSRILFCHQSGIRIVMLIDEEHKYKETANEYVSNIQPNHVLRISATPISLGDHVEVISDDEVIAAGLISSGISINEGVSKAIQENNNLDDDLLLIDLADKKRKQIQKEYDSRGLKIRPLVIIQFPNGSEEWILRIKAALEDLGYGESTGLVTSWFSGKHPDNPEELKKLDGQYSFLLFKQAIATGWDCPRSKILVKLREGGTERFNIQTIGRIRRMPERKHYGCELLDNCYVFTLDSEFTEGLTNSITDSFYTYSYKKKNGYMDNVCLIKESLDGHDRVAVNPVAVIDCIRNRIMNECDLNHDGIVTKEELSTSKGFVFGTKLKTQAIEGVARTTHDIKKLNTIFGGEHQINNHDDGFIIRDAKRRISASMQIDENISNNALKVLFGPLDLDDPLLTEEEINFEKSKKVLPDMSLKEYNAFLVNNRDLLIKLLSEINQDEIAELEETEIKQDDWRLPQYQYYKQHKKFASTFILGKNAFEDYGNNILIQPNRSYTEIMFEKWCESNSFVKSYYKNGDKGDEYFSVVYRKAFRRNNFYPDYIVEMQNGDIWIIEAKGGMTPEGQSNNIDRYASNKFEGLKDYAKRHNITTWGFVRAVGAQLYISNQEWTEDVGDGRYWLPIEMIMN